MTQRQGQPGLLPDWAKKSGRDPETGVLRPRRCDLYLPGHSMHSIQSLHSHRDTDTPPVPGKVVSVEGEVVTVELADGLHTYRNHAPERLVELLGPAGSVTVQERWSLLRIDNYCFCIARSERPWRQCEDEPLLSADPAALAERLSRNGGFTVAGARAVAALEERDDEA